MRANPQAFVSWILGDAQFLDELPEKLKTWNLVWDSPIGRDVIHFFFESIELSELAPDDLLVMEQPGLLPLLPLTEGGASKEVTEQMFARLQAKEHADLLAIGSTLASLVFKREHSPDLEWLFRRLRAMHDILRESPFYQEILQEGREEGLVKGLEEGLQRGRKAGLEEGIQEGKLEGQREILLALVQARFPAMALLAKKLVAVMGDSASLQDVTVKISMAQTDEEVQQYLLEGIEKSGS